MQHLLRITARRNGRSRTLYCCFYDGIKTSPPAYIACSLAWSLLPHSGNGKTRKLDVIKIYCCQSMTMISEQRCTRYTRPPDCGDSNCNLLPICQNFWLHSQLWLKAQVSFLLANSQLRLEKMPNYLIPVFQIWISTKSQATPKWHFLVLLAAGYFRKCKTNQVWTVNSWSQCADGLQWKPQRGSTLCFLLALLELFSEMGLLQSLPSLSKESSLSTFISMGSL